MYNAYMKCFNLSLAMLSAILFTVPVVAVERVSLERDGKSIHVDGRIVVEAADGGLLLQDDNGVLWAITPDEIVSRDSDAFPFEPLDKDAIGDDLLQELPNGFRVHKTAHYVLCYNTSPAYAEWCGALFERLYLAFTTYWSRRGFELHEPEWPLVALIFDRKSSYASYAKSELGAATMDIPGYYSLRTNRVIMYDLTGAGGVAGQRTTVANITRSLSRPGAERNVATIIHEATHQVEFNCGLHTRYADIPLWVSEGIANYFETPDLKSSKGWRNIGSVNRFRLAEFKRNLRHRQADSLKTLLSNDERFRNPRTALQAYAEAWALNYFLIRKHSKEYMAYMQTLAKKRPLRYDDPEERLALFRQAFGDLDQLNTAFLRYTRQLR
ncbi:MAG: hypothetical protein CMJ64_11070 [Planctomycetaceae bacterium]|jgi:hypothetical protein|nr:hypothetical protein [Planctomycetaceae bacterium]